MTITYNSSTKLIKIEAAEITAFADNIGDYESVLITGNINCCSTSIEKELDTTEILVDTNPFYLDTTDKVIYVRPEFFNLVTDFIDGVYKFTIKLKYDGGHTLFENCYFVDVTYKCKVAALLQDILKENAEGNSDSEKTSTLAHILHYALVNGSNCACNCADMCEIFSGLKDILESVDPTTSGCGC